MRRSSLRSVTACALAGGSLVHAVASAASLPGVLLQAAAAPTTSATADADADARKQEAIEHFSQGVALMQNESWDAAYAEFAASLALFPTKNADKNAAVCLRQLGRFDEALATYEALVRDFGGKLTAQERETVDKAMSDLRALTGTVVVQANVEGATVVIDGRDRGKTPLAAPVIVAAGTHVVRIAKEGFLPYEAKPVVAGKASVTVVATLRTLAASGRIRVVEEGGKVVDVVIDGALVGKTPFEGTLPPGNHAIALRGEARLGTQPALAKVLVDQTTVLRLAVESLGGDARIEPEPAGATVAIDGVPVGQGAWDGPLRLGPHKLDVAAEGYFGATQSVEVIAGKKAELKIVLERDESSPLWAKGRRHLFSVALFGGLAVGKSLGGDFEKCSAGECTAHSLPIGLTAGLRAAYELAPALSIELDFGYASFKGQVSRHTTLEGDAGVRVAADLTDSFRASGPLLGLGVAFAFVRKPVRLSAALEGGVVFAKVREARAGTVTVDTAPTARALDDVRAIDPVAKVVPWFLPELRLGVPLGDAFEIGAGLGALVAIADATPRIAQAPEPDLKINPDGTRAPVAAPTAQGRGIGVVPHTSDERATGTFVLPQATMFARMAF